MRTLLRHQAGAIVSTTVDFATMMAVVELLGVQPVAATIAGACAGAVTNFTLGRHIIFRAQEGRVLPQALRYALVSALSAGWNALGEWVFHDRLGLQYVLARVLVAGVVSVAWNFPMHRHFVFRRSPAA
jgi:putative flippase GtrA